MKDNRIDVTHLGSRHKEFINGIKESGEVTVEMNTAPIIGMLKIGDVCIPMFDEDLKKIGGDVTIPLNDLSKKELLGLTMILLNRISELEINNG